MFKRIFFILLSSFVLFSCIAPIFSSAVVSDAPFSVVALLDEAYIQNLNSGKVGYFISSGVDNSGFYYAVSVPSGFSIYNVSLDFGQVSGDNTGPYIKATVSGPANISFVRTTYRLNLRTGNLYTNERTYTTNSSGTVSIEARSTTYFPLNQFDFYKIYAYSLGVGSIIDSTYLEGVTNSFVQYLRPKAADLTVHSMIPEPKADLNHYYVADSKYLYSFFVGYPALYFSLGTTAGSLNNSREFVEFVPMITKRDFDTLNLKFRNFTSDSVNLYVSKYDVVTGSFISMATLSLAVATSDDDFYVYPLDIVSPNDKGIWYSGFVNGDGLDGYNLLKITWDGQLDYHPDFVAMTGLLDSIYQQLTYLNEDSDTALTYLLNIKNFANIISLNSSAIVDVLNAFKLGNFERLNYTNGYLREIINLLGGQYDDSIPAARPDVDEGVSNYVSSESGIMNQFDSAQSDVDNIFSDIDTKLSGLDDAFYSLKMLLNTFVFNDVLAHGAILSLFIFSLAFGLVMLIIGRKSQ